MSLTRSRIAALVLLSVVPAAAVRAAALPAAPVQQASIAGGPDESQLLEARVRTAPVVIDGRELFFVRGLSAYPGEERAALIAENIRVLAEDPSFDPATLVVEEVGVGTLIRAGDGRRVMGVHDADGQVEGVSRGELTLALRARIETAIREHRAARMPDVLWTAALHAFLGLLVLLAGLVVLRWGERAIARRLKLHDDTRREGIGIQSFEIVRAERISAALRTVLRTARWMATLILAIVYLRFALGLFPWTRVAADDVGAWVISPLVDLGASFVGHIPNLVFLGVLIVIVRWILRLLLLFFQAVEAGRVKLQSFEPEWAIPTYRLARLGVVAFSLVVAYPYIPGSHSDAFKGVSLFLGVLFSLGSSSAISNTIAGYMLTYRRAFRVGDRVKIGDVVGEVTSVRLQVTHVRTAKNEEVTIPNSSILANQVVNYSVLAGDKGLLVYLSVGIGYETPWRQVEALLLLAAERTPGLKRDPAPFVLQRGLGDFAVTYELNGYCDNPHGVLGVLSEMSRNIQDTFNEYGVQIMTPNYEADPEQAKIVPRDQWHAAPAKPEESPPRR